MDEKQVKDEQEEDDRRVRRRSGETSTKTQPDDETDETGDAQIQYLVKTTLEVMGLDDDAVAAGVWDGCTPSSLYTHLKYVLQMLQCSVWEEDEEFTFNWEVNLRRLVVVTFCKDELESFTKDIRTHMKNSVDLKEFIRKVMTSNTVMK